MGVPKVRRDKFSVFNFLNNPTASELQTRDPEPPPRAIEAAPQPPTGQYTPNGQNLQVSRPMAPKLQPEPNRITTYRSVQQPQGETRDPEPPPRAIEVPPPKPTGQYPLSNHHTEQAIRTNLKRQRRIVYPNLNKKCCEWSYHQICRTSDRLHGVLLVS